MTDRKPIGLSTPYRQVIDKTAAKRIATVARPLVGLTEQEKIDLKNTNMPTMALIDTVCSLLKTQNT